MTYGDFLTYLYWLRRVAQPLAALIEGDEAVCVASTLDAIADQVWRALLRETRR